VIIRALGSRVTIVLDDSNSEKLRNLQAKMIRTSSKSVSFSHVLNLVLEEGLKKYKQ
jgi:hypothetical protein